MPMPILHMQCPSILENHDDSPFSSAMRFSFATPMWGAASVALAQTIDVYKFANCGCCTKWVEHLRSQGFTPQVHAMSDLHPIRRKLGVPQKLAACHTALVDGYVIEGAH